MLQTHHSRKLLMALSLPAIMLIISGCGGPEKDPTFEDPTASRLHKLFQLYTMAQPYTQGRPISMEKFKQIAKQLPAKRLKELKIEVTDDLFVSPRDNKPFKISFVTPSAPTKKPPAGQNQRYTNQPIRFYEAEGKDGKHWVVRFSGQVEEITQEQLQKALSGK